MITAENILNAFVKYNELAAAGADPVTERNLHALMMYALDSAHLNLDGDRLTFTKGAGPLKEVEIDRISGMEDLGSHMAIVMPASVILLDKSNGELHVYLPD